MEIILQITLFLLVAKIGGELAERVNLPPILGELLGGMILGPSLFNVLKPDDVMANISQIGIILLMFLAGLETNIGEMKRTGFVSLLTALGGVVVPLLLGLLVGYLYGWKITDSLFLGTILTATSVGITVRTLMDMGQLRTDVGFTILGAAVIDDVIGIIIFTIVGGVALNEQVSILGFLKLTGFIALFFLVSLKFGFWISGKLSRIMTALRTQEVSLTLTIIFIFALAIIGERIRVAGITGAFIAGIVMSNSPQKEVISNKVSSLGYGFFVPLFFVYIGVNANIYDITMIDLAVVVIILAIIGKIFGSGIMAFLGGFSRRDALKIGIGMVPRMEVALIIASLGLTSGVTSPFIYSLTVAIVLVTTLVTPPLIKLIFK
ncbi:MAG: cation:proton antiporter [Theionarchaea archaeon]|nr:cation:proton antiporter [Theionarchaea archaeon]